MFACIREQNGLQLICIFMYYHKRWYLFFPKIWPYSSDGKWKITFLKKIHGNIFHLYPVKMVFPFPTNMILPFCQESKVDLLPKNTLNDDISGLIEKGDIHPTKYGVSFGRKITDDEKVYSVKYV